MNEITGPNTAYRQHIKQALRELACAVEELLAPTYPTTPMPRPREFKIGHYVWPYVLDSGKVWWWEVHAGQNYYSLRDPRQREPSDALIADLLKECKYQPARILRVAEQIRAAAEWCRKRAEGRRRHAEEILQQQQRAAEAIEIDVALNALGR